MFFKKKKTQKEICAELEAGIARIADMEDSIEKLEKIEDAVDAIKKLEAGIEKKVESRVGLAALGTAVPLCLGTFAGGFALLPVSPPLGLAVLLGGYAGSFGGTLYAGKKTEEWYLKKNMGFAGALKACTEQLNVMREDVCRRHMDELATDKKLDTLLENTPALRDCFSKVLLERRRTNIQPRVLPKPPNAPGKEM